MRRSSHGKPGQPIAAMQSDLSCFVGGECYYSSPTLDRYMKNAADAALPNAIDADLSSDEEAIRWTATGTG
jgi:hypothetical protein